MDQPIEDKTYKQAREHLIDRLKGETIETLTQCCNNFLGGKSMEESTEWIQDETMKKAVRNRLIPMAIEIYLEAMKDDDFIAESTREEMIAFLREPLNM